MSSRHRLPAVLVSCALALAIPAQAHQGGSTGFATIAIDGTSIRYSLTLSDIQMPSLLAEQTGFGQPGVTLDYRPLVNAIVDKIHFASGDAACAAGAGQVVSPSTISINAIVDFVCPGIIRELSIRDDIADTFGTDYHTLAFIVWTGGSQQFAFTAEARETQISVGQVKEVSRGAGSFFPLGVEHILTGYDHLVFLLALILRGGNVWSLLKIITAFTIAHSVTLALAALNMVVMPERLIEATIALSIAYVAAENLFLKHAVSHRWAVSFLFGLVHGFGFSNVLRELGLPKEGLAWSLLNFNLGVEAGQAVAVLIAVPALIWLHRFRWEPRAVTAISILVLVAGLGLFVDRAFFESFG